MKEKWYRKSVVKGVLILLEHVFLCMAVFCGIFLVDQYSKGNVPADVRSHAYTDTEGFSNQVYEMSSDILKSCSWKDLLNGKNSDGSKRLVDLEEVNQNVDYTFENNSGLAYYLDDLKKWNSDYGNNDVNQQVVVCKGTAGKYHYYYADEFLNLLDEGTLSLDWDSSESMDTEEIKSREFNVRDAIEYGNFSEADSYGLKGIRNAKGKLVYSSIWNYESHIVQELYKPVGADSILDVVNENDNWNGRLTEAYSALDAIRDQMAQLENLEDNMNRYSEGNTNMTYLYVDLASKTVYTNKAAYKNYKDYQKSITQLKGTGSYLVVEPKLSDSSTSWNTNLQRWQELTESLGPTKSGGNYVYAVSVDPDFTIGDTLAQYNQNYQSYAKMLIPAMVLCISCGILFFVGMIWLILVAGRRSGDEQLHLNHFDHLFTEIAAVGVFLIWIIPSSLGISVGDTGGGASTDNIFTIVTILVAVAWFCGMFLVGVLSLARRIKGKTLWKESLLRWLLGWISRTWRKLSAMINQATDHFTSVPRTILVFGGFLLVQLIFMLMFLSGAPAIFLLFALVLDLVVLYHYIKRANGRQMIIDGLKRITDGEVNYKIPVETLPKDMQKVADYINRIGEGLDAAIENSLKNERMKTELITNVSHDIKTPLTSIINYIALLRRENFTDPKILGYLDVLESKSQRLKILTEDVVEASKVTTGNISLEMTDLNLVEMVNQVIGEFQEKMEEKGLDLKVNLPEEPAIIHADGRRMWRVLANVFNNVSKYAMGGTRVYVDLSVKAGQVEFSLKNISENPLNISADELTERFIRGDVARSTEGSGLGLSIAKSLTQLQQGNFQIYLDGDLFKILISFPCVKN